MTERNLPQEEPAQPGTIWCQYMLKQFKQAGVPVNTTWENPDTTNPNPLPHESGADESIYNHDIESPNLYLDFSLIFDPVCKLESASHLEDLLCEQILFGINRSSHELVLSFTVNNGTALLDLVDTSALQRKGPKIVLPFIQGGSYHPKTVCDYVVKAIVDDTKGYERS